MTKKFPLIGAHVSSAGDLTQAPLRAHASGCECFQFFSRPPQGGNAKPITSELAQSFKANSAQYNLESYIHAPYLVNLASASDRIYYASIKFIRDELDRGSLLGVKYIMTHLGSAKDLGDQKGVKKVIQGIVEVLKGYRGSTGFLIEISAGAGAIIGDTFEELAEIINSPKLKKYDIGVCFDTCHAFASGYDLRTASAVKKTFTQFDKILGLDKLKLIHANDSITELGSHKDRHTHIGQGEIGLAGFEAVVKLAKKQKINLILETPHDEQFAEDIKILKKMRSK